MGRTVPIDINAVSIIDLRMRHPFQPFRLRLTSGESIVVEYPWQIATAPNAGSCAAYDATGDLRLVRYRDVAELDTVLPD